MDACLGVDCSLDAECPSILLTSLFMIRKPVLHHPSSPPAVTNNQHQPTSITKEDHHHHPSYSLSHLASSHVECDGCAKWKSVRFKLRPSRAFAVPPVRIAPNSATRFPYALPDFATNFRRARHKGRLREMEEIAEHKRKSNHENCDDEN